jgi:hypothetical protein
MSRSVATVAVTSFIAGSVVGVWGALWVGKPHLPPAPSEQVVEQPKAIGILQDEVAMLKKQLEHQKVKLEEASKVSLTVRAAGADSARLDASLNGGNNESAPEERTAVVSETENNAARWKISAIEKFVPLTEDQRERLQQSFSGGPDRPKESLEEILGAENAEYYRSQVKAAFQRMEEQELEKEVVFTSRQLALSSQQESQIRIVFQDIERELDTAEGDARGGTPQERVGRMVEQNKKRQALRNERVHGILSPEQYQAFLKTQSESPEADMEVFHDSGGGEEESR